MKILTDVEMGRIIADAISGDLIDCADAYEHFLEDLGDLIAQHFGGDRMGVSRPDADLGWTCAFQVNDCVPDDGGAYAKYDTDVIWDYGGGRWIEHGLDDRKNNSGGR